MRASLNEWEIADINLEGSVNTFAQILSKSDRMTFTCSDESINTWSSPATLLFSPLRLRYAPGNSPLSSSIEFFG